MPLVFLFLLPPPPRPRRRRARTEFGSSNFKNTPPIRISQTRGSRLASLGGQFVLFLGRKGKGFINEGQKKFFNHKTMRYIIYARKSTESEERQVLSIESQISELREFAAKEKLEIVASLC